MSPELAAASAPALGRLSHDTALHGRWVLGVRLAWIGVAGVSLGLSVLAFTALLDRDLTAIMSNHGLLEVTPEIVRALRRVGLSDNAIGNFFITLRVLGLAVFALPAVAIFWRKSDDWITALVALMLAAGGAALFAPLGFLLATHPSLELPIKLVGVLSPPSPEFGRSVAGVSIVLVMYLIPDGRFVPRWTRTMAIVLAAHLAGWILLPGSFFNVTHWAPSFQLAWMVGFPMTGVFAQIYRYVRISNRAQREQIKLVVLAFAAVPAVLLFLYLVPKLSAGAYQVVVVTPGQAALYELFLLILLGLALILLPTSIALSVLRYRLYDIDIVISKTVVFGALAAFITAAYVGIAVGIGAAVGGQGSVLLSILATAVIAVGFQPMRERARRFANRIVYGTRATPYEVLSEFAERVSSTYSMEDILPKTARILAEGTGAKRAEVWLRVGSTLRRVAFWPQRDGDDQPHELETLGPGDELPMFHAADMAVDVRHQDELLGALTIAKPPNEPVTPAEEKLLCDLASQAGLVLRNVALIDDLKASRQRLVAAQDQERRRLERNLHDGAQQHLVALKVKVGLAKKLAERDPAKAAELLPRLEDDAEDALTTLRDLARGIYPPLLADRGLATALNAHAAKAPVTVEVNADGIPRFSQEIESAVYFFCLEALQNVAKYGGGCSAEVTLAVTEDTVVFCVRDNGPGFDPKEVTRGSGLQNMGDRMEALSGVLEIVSAPGRGAKVCGRIPAKPLERAT